MPDERVVDYAIADAELNARRSPQWFRLVMWAIIPVTVVLWGTYLIRVAMDFIAALYG